MTEEVTVNTKVTEEEFNKMVAPFQLDLIAFYHMLMNDVFDLIKKAEEEGKTPEELLQEVNDLL